MQVNFSKDPRVESRDTCHRCLQSYSLLNRRKSCRICGLTFCAQCGRPCLKVVHIASCHTSHKAQLYMEEENGRLKVAPIEHKDSQSLLFACHRCAEEIDKAMRYHEARIRGSVRTAASHRSPGTSPCAETLRNTHAPS
jgi:hypothetical protein